MLARLRVDDARANRKSSDLPKIVPRLPQPRRLIHHEPIAHALAQLLNLKAITRMRLLNLRRKTMGGLARHEKIPKKI